MADRKPRIAFLGTGGTISFTGRDSLDTWEYMDFGTRLAVSDILARFPEVSDAAEIVPFDVRQVSSSGIVPDDWLALTAKIREVDQTRDDIDGIVVTHGTATLEETAYFLNLTAKTELPVVIIGAQRPSSGFATDAGSNLLAAVHTAGSKEARGIGLGGEQAGEVELDLARLARGQGEGSGPTIANQDVADTVHIEIERSGRDRRRRRRVEHIDRNLIVRGRRQNRAKIIGQGREFAGADVIRDEPRACHRRGKVDRHPIILVIGGAGGGSEGRGGLRCPGAQCLGRCRNDGPGNGLPQPQAFSISPNSGEVPAAPEPFI
jgi:hypothetical protein